MFEKSGSKVNSWLMDEELLKATPGVEQGDMESFINTSKYLYKFFITCPSPLFISWDRLNKAYYISVGNKYSIIPFNPKITVYDFQELVDRWVRRHYPSYTVYVDEKEEYSSEEIAELIQKGGDPDKLFNSYKMVKKKETCVIEKLLIKDDQIHVKINDITKILIARPDKPISVFISSFRKIENDEEKKQFMENFTKSIMQLNYLKTIEINYEKEYLTNFFKIRVFSNHKEKFLKTEEKNVYRWGRFLIRFTDIANINEAKNIIKECREKYSKTYEDSILKDEFKIKFGEKNIKKKPKENKNE